MDNNHQFMALHLVKISLKYSHYLTTFTQKYSHNLLLYKEILVKIMPLLNCYRHIFSRSICAGVACTGAQAASLHTSPNTTFSCCWGKSIFYFIRTFNNIYLSFTYCALNKTTHFSSPSSSHISA